MPQRLLDASETDLEAVLRLNRAEEPHVGSVDLAKMRWYLQHAAYFRIVRSDAGLDAFLIGFRAGSEYASPNYRWFCDRYADFAYVDRVAVAPHARRQGLASRLYRDFADSVPGSVDCMACEVNLVPPNETSMNFHVRDGFSQVGTLDDDGGKKRVAMLLKPLGQAANGKQNGPD